MSKQRKKQRPMPAQRESPPPIVVTGESNRIIGRGGGLDATVVTGSIKAEELPAGRTISSREIAELGKIETAVLRTNAGAIRAGTLADFLGDEQRKSLEESLAKASQTVSSRFAGFELPPEFKERLLALGQNAIRQQEIPDEVVILPPTPQPPYSEKKSKRKARRAPAREQIAKRVFRRQRQAVVAFLKRADLRDELEELGKVEAGVAKGSKRSCMHAAYSARVLLEGLADHLFPPISEKRKSRDGQVRALGAKDPKNRLIAYVEQQLEGQLEGADFRAFVGTLDAVMNWTGGGPHGSHEPRDAEHLYTRMFDALSVIARAHAAGSN